MGRKSIPKARKPLTSKAKVWIRDLIPLIQDQPLDKLTLDELAVLMGKSKSTIYSYFSTKEEIYQTVVQLVLDDMMDLISTDTVEGKNMELVLQAVLLKISEGIKGISIGFLEQIQLHFQEVWLIIEHFTDRLLTNFEIIYKYGMQEGSFRQFNLQLLLALDRYFVMSIMTDAKKFSTQGMSLHDLVQEYIELRLNALRVT